MKEGERTIVCGKERREKKAARMKLEMEGSHAELFHLYLREERSEEGRNDNSHRVNILKPNVNEDLDEQTRANDSAISRSCDI